ncbi:MAG TPA: hypothetical protein VD886_08530 [Herpetosiphonaceae bacterium]|nr:hypothetical protein [Herpetosiphonaceae bacterium]
MARTYRFELTSRLAAPAPALWRHATSMSGVNREFFPLLRMTSPPGLAGRDLADAPLGRPAFRSWILLFGLLPIDYDDLTFVAIDPPHGFQERSTMLTMREWNHERRIAPAAGGCDLTDRISCVPRVAALGPIQIVLFGLAFRLRHRNLRRLFGQGQP